MRISIWEQFSSNHSGAYTIVGQFDSPEAAQKAAAELEGMFKGLFHDYNEWRTTPEGQAFDTGHEEPPSPPELKVVERYGLTDIEENFCLGPDVEASLSITPIEHVVILNVGEIVVTEVPRGIVEIFRAMGPQAMAVQHDVMDDEFRPFIDIHLTCTAPNEETAASLEEFMDESINNGKLEGKAWKESEAPTYGPTVEEGAFSRDGLKLSIRLRIPDVKDGLLWLDDFLKSQNCQEIEYNFTEEPNEY